MAEACCTCATLLSNISPLYDEKTEKPAAQDRRLACCGRVICGSCIYNNPRFGNYCPFCQISNTPSSLPQGLRDPPAYAPPSSSSSSSPTAHTTTSSLPIPSSVPRNDDYDTLPPYTTLPHLSAPLAPEKSADQSADDVLHFINHDLDSVTSLSLRYGVPIAALRRANGLTSDHLLRARRTVVIPGEFYRDGVSLSPRPLEGEEEEARKGKIRRWMVGCKVAEYDVAVLYLKQADYDLEAAIEAYRDDERWEKEHPIEGSGNGKGKMRHDLGKRRFTGQRS